MNRVSKDEYFISMLHLVSARSTCARRAVGAIFVDADGRILSTGYNGVPRLFPHCTDSPCAGVTDAPGQTDRCNAVHAEINAIIQCHRMDLLHTAYISASPCFACGKALANTTLARVVFVSEYSDTRGIDVLRAAMVSVEHWNGETRCASRV